MTSHISGTTILLLDAYEKGYINTQEKYRLEREADLEYHLLSNYLPNRNNSISEILLIDAIITLYNDIYNDKLNILNIETSPNSEERVGSVDVEQQVYISNIPQAKSVVTYKSQHTDKKQLGVSYKQKKSQLTSKQVSSLKYHSKQNSKLKHLSDHVIKNLYPTNTLYGTIVTSDMSWKIKNKKNYTIYPNGNNIFKLCDIDVLTNAVVYNIYSELLSREKLALIVKHFFRFLQIGVIYKEEWSNFSFYMHANSICHMVKDKMPNNIMHICNYIRYNFDLQPYYIIDDYFNPQTSVNKSYSFTDTLEKKAIAMTYKKKRHKRKFEKKSIKKKPRLKILPPKKKPKKVKKLNYEK